MRLRARMAFTIEPLINAGRADAGPSTRTWASADTDILLGMRQSLRCPKCTCRKLWRMYPFMVDDMDSSNVVKVLAGVARFAGGTTKGGLGKKIQRGAFEVWICSACGLTEWYAAGVNEALADLSRVHDSGVAFVDGDAGAAPFR